MTTAVIAATSDAPSCLPPAAVPRTPCRRLPAGACDAHMHVFGSQDRYRLDPRRSYTPHVSPLAQYQAVMQALGIERAVLVQPSVYGTDNAALLDALREGGPAFRGVAVPPPDLDAAGLQAFHRAGVRGIRLNMVNPQTLSADDAVKLIQRAAPLGWHLHAQADLAQPGGLACLTGLMDRVTLPLVIEHMGRVDPRAVAPELTRLLRDGRCWVKLSAPYRVSREPAPHADLAPLVRALTAANPARLLWGSDWPHTEQTAAMPDTAGLAELLADWVPDRNVRHAICVDNPARLYGY